MILNIRNIISIYVILLYIIEYINGFEIEDIDELMSNELSLLEVKANKFQRTLRRRYDSADPDADRDIVGFPPPPKKMAGQPGKSGWLLWDTFLQNPGPWPHTGSLTNDLPQSDWFADHFAHTPPEVAHLHEDEYLARIMGWPADPVGPPLQPEPVNQLSS